MEGKREGRGGLCTAYHLEFLIGGHYIVCSMTTSDGPIGVEIMTLRD